MYYFMYHSAFSWNFSQSLQSKQYFNCSQGPEQILPEVVCLTSGDIENRKGIQKPEAHKTLAL